MMPTETKDDRSSRGRTRTWMLRGARLLGFCVVLVSLRWIVLRLGADGAELAAFRPPAVFLWLLAAATPLWAATGLLQGVAWHRLLRVLGGEDSADLARDLRLHARLQVAKYLPGHAFQVGRHALTRSESSPDDDETTTGVPHSALGAAATCEALGQTVAGGSLALLLFGLAFGGGALGLGKAAPEWILRWAPWLGLVAVVAVPWLVSRLAGSRLLPGVVPHRPHRLLPALGLYAMQFLVGGAIFGCLLASLGSGSGSGVEATVLAGLAAYPLAWVVGFLTPATPAGTGAVEAVLVATLGARYGAVEVLVAAVGFRVATLLGDLLLALGAWSLRRREVAVPTLTPAAPAETPSPETSLRVHETPALVIGAGPYGIAVAQELWHRGREQAGAAAASPIAVGEPFATWHHHTLDVMSLRSDPRGSSIWSPDDRYDFVEFLEAHDEADMDDDVVPVTLYRSYLEQVADSVPFPLIRGRIEHLERSGDGFVARGRDESDEPFRVETRNVVVATGLGAHRHLPQSVERLPAERVLHSWDAEAIESLHDARVLVIGGGQSAAESVLALGPGERNWVTWALRRPPLFFREPLRVPTPLFKLMLAGSRLLFRLPPPILRAVGRAVFRTTITPSLKPVWEDDAVEKKITDAADLRLEATEDRVRDADGDAYDVVVSATGYRHTLAGLPFLSDDLVERLGGPDRPPKLDGDFACQVPGLYFVGGIAEPTHGPAMRFVLGSRHAARRLGKVLGPSMAATKK